MRLMISDSFFFLRNWIGLRAVRYAAAGSQGASGGRLGEGVEHAVMPCLAAVDR